VSKLDCPKRAAGLVSSPRLRDPGDHRDPEEKKKILYLFTTVSAKPPRGGVSRTWEAKDGFQELQDGFMRFLKRHLLGANLSE